MVRRFVTAARVIGVPPATNMDLPSPTLHLNPTPYTLKPNPDPSVSFLYHLQTQLYLRRGMHCAMSLCGCSSPIASSSNVEPKPEHLSSCTSQFWASQILSRGAGPA